MNRSVKYAFLFGILILLVIYIAFGQVTSTHTRHADFLKLDWVTSWNAPDTLMGQMPGFLSGPFVFVEHVDVETGDDGSIYTGNNLLRKINPGGGIAWESSVVLEEDIIPAAIYFNDVCVDESGDVYGLGHIRYTRESYASMSTVEDELIIKTMFITKHSPDGALEWQRIWDDAVRGRVWGVKVIPDPDGNPVIIGNMELSIYLDPGDSAVLYDNTSNPKFDGNPDEKLDVDDYDGFAIRLSAGDGEYIDSVIWPGTIYDAVPWKDRGIVFSSDKIEFDELIDTEIPGDVDPEDSVFVVLNWGFDEFEVTSISPPCNRALIRTIAVTPNGDLVAGGTIDGDDRVSCFVSLFDSNFDLLNSHEISEFENEIYPLDIAVSESGEIYAAGGFASKREYRRKSLDFDPGKAKDIHAGQLYEIFITKYSPDGSYEWTGSFGGERNDWAGAVEIDTDGKILLLGYYQNAVDFDPSPEAALQSTHSDISEFLARFSEWQG